MAGCRTNSTSIPCRPLWLCLRYMCRHLYCYRRYWYIRHIRHIRLDRTGRLAGTGQTGTGLARMVLALARTSLAMTTTTNYVFYFNTRVLT